LQHSEKYIKGSRAFQIWFNPDFSKSLKKEPNYKDYQADSFKWIKENEIEVKHYVGKGAPIETDAPGISAKRYKVPKGKHSLNIDLDSFHSLYLMEGKINLEGNTMEKESFVKINGIEKIDFVALEDSELFILQSPLKINYESEH